MSIIKISDLSPVGADLFEDTESYLTELTEQEMSIFGGKSNSVNNNTFVDSAISLGNTVNANTENNNNTIVVNSFVSKLKIKVGKQKWNR